MNIASRFQTLPEESQLVDIILDGEPVTTSSDVSLAATLLAHSGDACRRTVNGAERAPFCMMGICFDCLVEVDGIANTQACMTIVREGMIVKRQIGLRRFGGGKNV